MKIVDMRATPIAVGDPPLLNAMGMHAAYALRTVVELENDCGTLGISEIPGGEAVNRDLAELKEVVVGGDPFNLNCLERSVREWFCRRYPSPADPTEPDRRLNHIVSAVEVACLDIQGKESGRSVVDLLGGPCRETVPVTSVLFFKPEGAGGPLGMGVDPHTRGWEEVRQRETMDAAAIVGQGESMCRFFGFKALKLKGGVLSPHEEYDCLAALREALGPAVNLRFDPNAVWSMETAVNWGKRMEGLLEYWEDPVRGQQAMADLRGRIDIPLATNMCTKSFADLPVSVALHSEDIVLVDHHHWGGLRAAVAMGRMGLAFHRGISMHANTHMGISLMAMIHLAAAVPNLTYAIDVLYPWQSDDIIEGGRLEIKDGRMPVPQRPGLGVELDRSALEHAHKAYESCGIRERDDAEARRKVDPDWRFQSVSW